VSLHCWQDDEMGGFENDLGLTGGIQTTVNYPVKARTADQPQVDHSFPPSVCLSPGSPTYGSVVRLPPVGCPRRNTSGKRFGDESRRKLIRLAGHMQLCWGAPVSSSHHPGYRREHHQPDHNGCPARGHLGGQMPPADHAQNEGQQLAHGADTYHDVDRELV
jgi:hypothetical protein